MHNKIAFLVPTYPPDYKYTNVLNTVTPSIDIIITLIHIPFRYFIFFINFFIQNGVSTIKVTNHL